MISTIMSGQSIDDQGSRGKSDSPKLEFGADQADVLSDMDDLRSKAMASLRERRLRLK